MPEMSDQTDDFVHMWEWFSTHCHGYSPLYERISLAVAGDRDLLDALRGAPPDAHLPPALLAAVHYLLLEGEDHPLADVYAARSDADPGPLFLDLCRTRREEVMALLATRRIQTNDCGRSALIAPGLTWAASRHPGPLALVDVGASAGLNLLLDQYRIDYGAHGVTGPPESPVEIACRVRGGDPPIAGRLPSLAARVGIDRSPIDLSDAGDARWLLACVWPDTDRLERTAASIRLAQGDPPRVVVGEANDVLPQVLADLPDGATAAVVTTWVFAYFSLHDRQRFVELLATASSNRPIVWVSAESAGVVEAFASESVAGHDHSASDVLGAVSFDRGSRRVDLLAFVQEHGAWVDWRA
jgi:hypothetical protein